MAHEFTDETRTATPAPAANRPHPGQQAAPPAKAEQPVAPPQVALTRPHPGQAAAGPTFEDQTATAGGFTARNLRAAGPAAGKAG